MELIGKWKIKKVFCITPEGMELITPADIPQGEDYDEYRRMSRAIFDFHSDGVAYMLLPPEDFKQMDTGEELRLLDGMAIVEEHPWKEESGADVHYLPDRKIAEEARPVLFDGVNAAIWNARRYAWDGKDTTPMQLEWKHTQEQADDAFAFLRRMLELGTEVSITEPLRAELPDGGGAGGKQTLSGQKPGNRRILSRPPDHAGDAGGFAAYFPAAHRRRSRSEQRLCLFPNKYPSAL